MPPGRKRGATSKERKEGDAMETASIASSHGGSQLSLASCSVIMERERASRKRVRTEVSSAGEADYMSQMREICNSLRTYLLSDDHSFERGPVTNKVLETVQTLQDIIVDTKIECEKYKAMAETLADMGPVQQPQQRSFADVASTPARRKVSGAPVVTSRVPEKKYAVVVRPTTADAGASSDAVRSKVLEKIKPKLPTVCVKNVRKLRQPGIAIEVASEKDLAELKSCNAFAEVGLQVNDPKKIGPKVIVLDVEKSLSDEDLMEEICSKNLSGAITPDLRQRMRICARLKSRNVDDVNVIIEVPLVVRDMLCLRERIYIGWRSLRIKPYDNVERCFKCYGYNHRAAECKYKDRACRKCGKEGHMVADCRETEIECRLCKGRSAEFKHSITSMECPEYQRALLRARAKITDGP